jgi:hypothetical protein
MTREQWKDRLLKANLPEEVVDDLLKKTKDEDLVRMKDLTTEEIVEVLKGVAMKAEDASDDEEDEETPAEETLKCEKCDTAVSKDASFCKGCGTKMGEKKEKDETADVELLEQFVALKDAIVAELSERFGVQEVEIEVPEIAQMKDEMASFAERFESLEQTLKDMAGVVKDAASTETDILSRAVGNLSTAQMTRLRAHFSRGSDARAKDYKRERGIRDPGPDQIGADDLPDGTVVIENADGTRYSSLAEAAGMPG